jgi:hypothetical protein
MVVVDGNPAIVYTTGNPDFALKYQRALDPYGLTWDTPVTVDDGQGATGGTAYPALAVVDGYPTIAYAATDGTDLYVRYVRAADDSGSSWGSPQTVITTPGNNPNLFTELAVVNGNPAIAYTTNSLYYIRALNADGSSWPGGPRNPSNGAAAGNFSMSIVDGRPAIAFEKNTAGVKSLAYVRANNGSGDSWPLTPVTVVSGYMGSWFEVYALSVTAANPALTFYEDGQGLRYVYADDDIGSSWPSPATLDADGAWASIAAVDGKPAVSYVDLSDYSLNYMRATSADGSGWGAAALLTDDPYTVRQTHLLVVSGNPAVTFFNWDSLSPTEQRIRYIRATDPDGHGGWALDVAANLGPAAGATGLQSSMAMIGGKPAVAYWRWHPWPTNQELWFVAASDSSGSAWDEPVLVDDNYAHIGLYPSLAEVDGRPAISYWNQTNGTLMYSRADNAAGSAWPASPAQFSYDAPNVVGLYTSLAVVNGNPAISYYDQTNGNLKYVRASDASGSTWTNTPRVVAFTNDVGRFTSLKVVNGYPAISYYSATGGDLLFCQATHADGNTWGTPVTVDSTGDVGLNTSLAIVDGNPAIGYWDQTNSALKYVRAGNANGSSWPSASTLSSDAAEGASLAVVNGVPALCYESASTNDLYYVAAGNASGSSWSTPQLLDNTGITGYSACLCEIGGSAPGISYVDLAGYNLRYIYGF